MVALALISFLTAQLTLLSSCASHSDGGTTHWTTHRPAGQKFSVELPGAPEVSEGDISGQTSYNAVVRSPDSMFLFSFFDVPDDQVVGFSFEKKAEEGFEAARVTYVARLGRPCDAESPQRMTVLNYEAFEAVIHCGPGARSRVRLVNALPRLYQMVVSGSEMLVDGADAHRFFDSLKFESER